MNLDIRIPWLPFSSKHATKHWACLPHCRHGLTCRKTSTSAKLDTGSSKSNKQPQQRRRPLCYCARQDKRQLLLRRVWGLSPGLGVCNHEHVPVIHQELAQLPCTQPTPWIPPSLLRQCGGISSRPITAKEATWPWPGLCATPCSLCRHGLWPCRPSTNTKACWTKRMCL